MLHKVAYEEVYRKPYVLDERDQELLAERTAKWIAREGPRVGDYLVMRDGTKLRFTHDWGDTLQTTSPNFGYGSFYFDRCGHMSFSGALDPGVPKTALEVTGDGVSGACWFFSHDFAMAHNGVYVTVPCRVYRLKDEVK